MIKDFIIRLLEILTFIFFAIIVYGFASWANILNLGFSGVYALIAGIFTATFICGFVLLSIQNNELLKEIRG